VIPEVRRSTLLVLQNSLGRALVVDDLLDRLRALGTVDDSVADALRRDIEQMGPAKDCP
jgi:hypothetical protein